MNIVRFYEHGGPEVLRLEEVGEPRPGRGEVLVKTQAIGVNFTDLSTRKGATLREPVSLPYTPGVEVAGLVVGVGEGCTRFQFGDRVLALVPRGGYAEFLAIPEVLAFPIPEGIAPELAVAVPLQGLTAYHILKTLGRIQPGERVLVQAAAGGVGSLAVSLARLWGAQQVVATAGSDEKVALARSWGADAGVNYSRPGWREEVLKVTDGHGVDLFLDMLGGEAFSDNFATLAPFGRIVTYGAVSGRRATVDSEKLTSRCHTVSGFFAGFTGRQQALVGPPLKELFQWVLEGRLTPRMSGKYPLSEAAMAHQNIEARQTTGKVILLPSQ